jgi:hypothetical protein
VSGASPSGTVTFHDGTTSLGEVSLDTTSSHATLSVGTLSQGAHSLSATYNGDINNTAAATAAPVLLNVQAADACAAADTVFCDGFDGNALKPGQNSTRNYPAM